MANGNLDLRLRIRADSKELVGALSRAQSGLRGLARVGATVSRAFGRMTRDWRTLVVGLGTIVGLRAVVAATVRQEEALARVAVRVRGLGSESDLTTRSLAEMAAELQKVTIFGDEAILEGQGLLLTFQNLRQADSTLFERATKTVLDLASAMGTDLRSAAIAMAKALDDPVRGLDGLSRSGTTFSKEQQQVIRSLFETGRQAEAMALILDTVDAQVGGTAEALRNTLGGSLKSLSNAWGDLLERTNNTRELRQEIEKLTEALSSQEAADAAASLGSVLAGSLREVLGIFESITRLAREYPVLFGALLGGAGGAAVGGKITRHYVGALGGGAVGAVLGALGADDLRRGRRGEIEDELKEEEERLGRAQETLEAQTKFVREVQALLDRRNKLARSISRESYDLSEIISGGSYKEASNNLADVEKEIEKKLGKVTVDAAADTQVRLENEVERIRGNISRLKGELAQLYAETLTPPGLIAQPSTANAAARLRRHALPPPPSVAHFTLDELRHEAARKRRRAVDEGGAIAAAQEQVSEEIALARDVADAHERAVRRIETADARLAGAQAVAALAARRWREEVLAGLDPTDLDFGAHVAAVDRIAAAMAQVEGGVGAALENRPESVIDGLRAGLEEFAGDAQTLGEAIRDATVGALSSMEDALVEFVRSGKLEFADLADSIVADLARIAIQQHITGPLAGFLGGLFSPASIAHEGGVIGRDPMPRRYHAGGIAGDEVPAILRRGEAVLTPGQMALLAPAGRNLSVRIEVENRGQPLQLREAAAPRFDGDEYIVAVVADNVARGGRVAQAMHRAGARR